MRTCLLLLVPTVFLCQPAAGQTPSPGVGWEVGVGVPRVLDDSREAVGMVVVLLPQRFLGVSPLAGVVGDTRGQLFAFAGVYRDLTRGAWRLTPAFAAGAYEQGRGRDLGGSPLFRSSLELSRRLSGWHRIGVQVAHVSNGGLGWRNPGQERLLVTWTVPFPGGAGRPVRN